MSESARHRNLLNAFSLPQCPVCTMMKQDIRRDMDTLMLERINKVETHLMFRAARGLCNAHAWQIKQAKGGALGIAVMYDSTMLELFKDIAKIQPSAAGFFGRKSAGQRAADQLAPTDMCLLCKSMNKSETSYVTILAENIHDPQLQAAFQESAGGVCLPHGRMILQEFKTRADVQIFLELQRPNWERLRQELQLFIEKNENNIPQHEMGAEGDSWQRAIAYLSGDAEIFGYQR